MSAIARPRAVPKAANKNATREKIVKMAERLMWREGYDAASLNDVVKKAGVSKGAFFHYYPNKQTITREVLERYSVDHMFGPLDKHMQAATNTKTGLLAWLEERYLAYAAGKYKGGCLLGNMTLSLADRDEELREQIKTLFLQWENQLVGYLKPAAAQGKLLMEPRQFARLILAAFQGCILTTKAHKDHNRASREFQAVAEMIERLVRD
ncbi:MAG: TetR/AcrR family transcriptional regulator [Alphaproteobacteria bacterium]|nr:TetR/AcrR family transcriptional regulator [Alphaproteobacteria bacterium]